MGRFISVDPIKDGTNWYVYCENNPIAFVDPSGLKSYIFYLSGWEERAQGNAEALMSMGINRNKIVLVPLSSEEDFEDAWNHMGTDLGEKIDHVIINTHGSPKNFGTKDKWNLSLDEIDELKAKDVKGNVILFGCNNGHLDRKNNNVASHLAEKVNGALVIAGDGTVVEKTGSKKVKGADDVRIQAPNGYARSQKDGIFDSWLRNGERDNAGWVIYRKSGNTVSTRLTGSKSKLLTIQGACQLSY